MIDIEKERMLISKSMMAEELRYSLVRMPNDFFQDEMHRKYHRALKNIIGAFKEYSGISVALELESMGIEHNAAVNWCTKVYQLSVTSMGWEILFEAVKNNWRCLKARNAATGFQESLLKVGFDKAVAEFNAFISGMQENDTDTSLMHDQEINHLLEPTENLPIGIAQIDAGIIGIPVQGSTTIAARSSQGKTAFVLSIIRNMCLNKHRVLMFSQETNKKDLTLRLISAETGINLLKLRQGRALMGSYEIEQATRAFENMKPWLERFEVFDRAVGMNHLFHLAKRSATVRGTKVICVDHAGLVKDMNANFVRREQLAEYTAKCKGFAMDHNVAFVNLWQINRQGAKEEPHMAQLKDTGSAEEDSDLILLLHATDEQKARDELTVIVDKNRNGPCGKQTVNFDRKTMRFW
jgi:replicative DNA helicase